MITLVLGMKIDLIHTHHSSLDLVRDQFLYHLFLTISSQSNQESTSLSRVPYEC